MRVASIQVKKYRGLKDLSISGFDDGLICLTGTNGSGKSALLEVIAHAARALGVAQGGNELTVESKSQSYDFEVAFDFTEDFSFDDVADLLSRARDQGLLIDKWNRILKVRLAGSYTGPEPITTSTVIVESLESFHEHAGLQLAHHVVQKLDERFELKLAMIDANRAYERDQNTYVNANLLEEWNRIWGKKAAALLKSQDLYQQWVSYLAQLDSSTLSHSRKESRKRVHQGESDVDLLLDYEDPMLAIGEQVEAVLPGVRLLSAEVNPDRLYASVRGETVAFEQLSGGEREVLFLVGQFQRLQLDRGVLLIDEPELHLNPSMVRRLVALIEEQANQAQVWIATHSFEAVEAAGPENTLLLSREADNSTSARLLADSSALVALAEALGRTGFSLVDTSFILVEGGGNSLREIPRYQSLAYGIESVEFTKIGTTKNDVKATLGKFEVLAEQSVGNLKVKAVVDCDYDSCESSDSEVRCNEFTLGVHECENLFLHPPSLQMSIAPLLDIANPIDVEELIQSAFEDDFGTWVWGRTEHLNNRHWVEDRVRGSVDKIKSEVWNKDYPTLQAEWHTRLVPQFSTISAEVSQQFSDSFELADKLRTSPDLWKHCNGKEVLKRVSRRLGFAKGAGGIETMVLHAWNQNNIPRPNDLIELRRFLAEE